MAKYVDIDKLLHSLPDDLPYKASVKRVLMQADEADVVEVRHGKWKIETSHIYLGDDWNEQMYAECPFCGRQEYVPLDYESEDFNNAMEYARQNYPYCHCGAKMDGKKMDRKVTE